MFVKSNAAGLAAGVALLEAYRPGNVVLIDAEDDEAFQEGASRFRRQQQLLEGREWLEASGDQVEERPAELVEFSPLFWLTVRLWILILVILFAILWYINGARPMSNPSNTTPPPAAAPESKDQPKGEPHGHTLQAQIKRFGDAVVSVATHPDNGMFFFDAQDVTVNDKLNTLKIRALIDTLCAAGVIERHRFENRLEELVTQTADKLVEGLKRIAITARVTPGAINGSGR